MPPVKTAPTTPATNGYYVYSEIFQKLARGYHFFVNAQAYKDDMKIGHADNLKFGVGMMAFPLARVEARIDRHLHRL